MRTHAILKVWVGWLSAMCAAYQSISYKAWGSAWLLAVQDICILYLSTINISNALILCPSSLVTGVQLTHFYHIPDLPAISCMGNRGMRPLVNTQW